MNSINLAKQNEDQGTFFFLGAVFFLSLWSFYLDGASIRVFDFFFLFLYLPIILFLYLQSKIHVYFQFKYKPTILAIILIQLIYCFVSVLIDPQNAPTSAIGTSLCLIVFAF